MSQVERSFFITLPSSTVTPVDWRLRNQNVLTDFRVELPTKISLEGEWQVALSEISYPNTFVNVGYNAMYYQVTLKPCDDNHLDNEIKFTCVLPWKHYTTGEELAFALTSLFEEKMADLAKTDVVSNLDKKVLGLRFIFENKMRHNTMIVRMDLPAGMFISFGTALRHMLGFSTNPKEMSSEMVANYPIDLMGSLHTMYVYADIVANQVVGNFLAPLLRTVPTETGSSAQVLFRQFNPPQYLDLAKREFQTIHIQIRDELGMHFPYFSGKILLILHFRKKKMGFYALDA